MRAAPGDWTFTTIAGVPEGGIGARDGTGVAARFNFPGGLAVHSDGTIYAVDILNHTIRRISPNGTVTTVAGLAGQSGSADGRGSAARFSEPRDLALDSEGNIYVADSGNNTIRKITPAGIVSTLAGTAGSAGSANGTGKSAKFKYPGAIAVDGSGNIYVADTENQVIRKVTQAGVVTTVAGSVGAIGTADGKGTAARFRLPQGIAADAAGNVYVADTENSTIRKIAPDGTVTTLAGTAGQSGTTDGKGSAARFLQPFAVDVAADGSLFVAQPGDHVVRRVTAAGEVTTVAGKAGTTGGVDGQGAAALFNTPLGIATGPEDRIYVADTYNHKIRTLTPAGAVATFAGADSASGTADGPGASARFLYTLGPAIGTDGTLYVSDVGNHTIRKISPAGEVTTFAGTAGSSGTNDGSSASARFQNPLGLAADSQNNVFVADSANNTIRKITPGAEVSTFAGTPGVAGTNDGAGGTAGFRSPQAVAVDKDDNIYIADGGNHAIRKITPAGEVTTLAGAPGVSGSANGTGTEARFNRPLGVAAGPFGIIYVADSYNHTIRKITAAGVVTTLAGKAASPGSVDGSADVARFNYPFGVAVDSGGTVYVADQQNHMIRRITPAGEVTTIGGSPGAAGSSDGTGKDNTRFKFPYSLAVDSSGYLYVADTYNHSLRKGYPALTDNPIVDRPSGAPGVVRQLDVANLSTTTWSWDFERYPSTSSAQLSSGSARNPTFTPDVADTFVLRFRGTDSQGRVAFGTVSVGAIVETVNPTLAITSPKNGQRVNTVLLNLAGTASDNIGVAEVWCRANLQPWVKANGSASWSASLTLAPGANTLQAYAVDLAGNNSAPASVTVTYVVSDQLGISVNGQGTLTPNLQNAILEVGKTFKVTAKPAAGQIFAYWQDETGAIVSRSPALTFTMRTGLQLKAVFIPNPFLPTKGSYAGLVHDPAFSHGHSGLFTAAVTDQGKLTSKMTWAGATYSLSGQLAGDGSFSNAVVRKGLSPLVVQLQLGLNGERTITGTITENGTASELLANQLTYSTASPAPQSGRKYTFVIPGSEDSGTRPGGYGYGTVSITAAGAATLSGVLADGTKFTQKTFVSRDATLPFYVALYAGKGSILGWVSLPAAAQSDVSGTLYWTKLPGAAGVYSAGFSFPEGLAITGSTLSSTSPLLTWSSGHVALELGGLSESIANSFTIAANKVSGTNKLTLTFTTTTGLFKGSVINPATGKPIPINGVVLQNQGAGYGYFLGTGQSGRVRLVPAP